MRHLVVLLLILTIPTIAYQAQPTRNKDKGTDETTEAQKTKETGAHNGTPAVVSYYYVYSNAVQPDKDAKADNSPFHSHDWIDRLNALSTAIIAIFTVGLFVGLWHQIRTSKTIERAWVMAEIQPDPEKPSNGRLQVFEGSGSSGDSTAVMNVVLNCSNAGKTPAWIEETIAKFEMVKNLPPTPNFESAQSIQHSTIPLGMAEGGAVPYTQKIQWTPIAEGHQTIDEMAVIYGRIVYRDIFREQRTTTFGYKIRPHGRLERLEGYPEYNKGT